MRRSGGGHGGEVRGTWGGGTPPSGVGPGARQRVAPTGRTTRRRSPDARTKAVLGPLAVSVATLEAADRHRAGVLRRFDATLEVPVRQRPARVRRSRWRAGYTRV